MLTGCVGTVARLFNGLDPERTNFYVGTMSVVNEHQKEDPYALKNNTKAFPCLAYCIYPEIYASIIFLPIDFAIDTALLPFDYVIYLFKEEKTKKPKPEKP